ncbi:MAG: hypothetical protein AAGF11_45475 [Myxococcota bacterium]
MSDDERAIARLLAGTGLREDDQEWTQAVFEAIDRRASRSTPRWRPLSILVPIAAAAAAVLLLPRAGTIPAGEGLPLPVLGRIEVERLAAAPGLRGDDLHPGDTIRVRARLPAEGRSELWIYREARALVLRCAGAPQCERRAGMLAAEIRLDAPGTHQILVVTGPGGLPGPTGKLDDDVAAVIAAAGEVRLSESIEVR